MRSLVLGIVVGLSSVLGASEADAQKHTHTKECEELLQQPAPYVPFENKQFAWLDYKAAKVKPYRKAPKLGDELLEQPAVYLLLSDIDHRSCMAAYYERVVFASRSLRRLSGQFLPIRFHRDYTRTPDLAKLFGRTTKPRIVVLSIDKRVVASFDTKVGAKSVVRGIRKALKAQRSIRRAFRAMTQNVQAAKQAVVKNDYQTAGERLARVLRPKAPRSPAWVEAKQLLAKVEQAGTKELKAISAVKEPLARYQRLLALEEVFRSVKTIRPLITKRTRSLEEGPETWRLIQEYKGTQQIKAAVELAKAGKRAKARVRLKEIEREYLGLACAQKARKLQARLRD